MSVLELKGSILGLVSQLDDETLLNELHAQIAAVVSEDAVPLDARQRAELELAVEESHDEHELLSYEQARATHSKWLRK